MAAHIRSVIRSQIVTALTGLPMFGGRVFASRVYPLENADLPGVIVFAVTETSNPSVIHGPTILERHAHMIVRAFMKATAVLDDGVDEMCREIETALGEPDLALTLLATALELVGTAEQPTGQATLTYDAVYYTPANAPDVSLDRS